MKGIKQLAEHLDISIGTVSRALNGKPDVNPATRKRVLEAAENFGYVPNQSGRSLRSGATNTIGFMIELSAGANAASDDFFMGVFDGVQAVLSRHELDLVILPCPAAQDPVDYIKRIVGRGLVDGLILSATMKNDARFDFLRNAGVPFIALGRSDSANDMRWIDLDIEGVARHAIDRLAAHGHKRIAAAVLADKINFGHLYLDSYQKALLSNGLPWDPGLVYWQQQIIDDGYSLAGRIAETDDPPTAIILSTEVLAPGLYRGLLERGIKPGEDIAIIGFRDNPRTRYLTPSLTCYSFSLGELGQALAETLLSGMPAHAQNYPGHAESRIWKMTFKPGESDDFTLAAEGV